jgi:rhodanese-related sulfurtransferase
MLHPRLKKVFLLSSLLFAGMAVADDYLSPDTINGTTKIDAETLIQLARDHDDLIIIDSRIRSDRRQGFITGSLSLPDTETNCATLIPIIHRKDDAVVFYCNGPKCRRSDRAVAIARDCGYTNIYWFRGGLEEWKNKHYLISK